MKNLKIMVYSLFIMVGLSGCQGCNCEDDRARFIGNWDLDTIVSSQSSQGELAEDYSISISWDDEDDCIIYIEGFEGFGNGVTMVAKHVGAEHYEIETQTFNNVINSQGRTGLTVKGDIYAILGSPLSTGGYGVRIDAEIWEGGTFYDVVSIAYRDQ